MRHNRDKSRQTTVDYLTRIAYVALAQLNFSSLSACSCGPLLLRVAVCLVRGGPGLNRLVSSGTTGALACRCTFALVRP
jgi:hypothetical protein